MANRLQKLLYYLSAGAPILIVFAITWLIKNNTMIVSIQGILCSLSVAFALGIIVLFALSFNFAKNNLSHISVKAVSVRNNDGWIGVYVISYFLPIPATTINEIVPSVMIIVIILLMLALTFTDHITPHPYLFFRGYHFYEVSIEAAQDNLTLASKQRIRKPADIHNVYRMFELFLINM